MNILITGVAGFIGFHLSKKLLDEKKKIFGIDNLNKYYDVNLKKDRINLLKKNQDFNFHKVDLSNKNKISNIKEDLLKIGFDTRIELPTILNKFNKQIEK